MIIRSEQIEVLAAGVRRQFEQDMLSHLHIVAPRHCKVIGDDAVLDVIRLGMERAVKYRFARRGPVRFYIELMFNLGSAFDTDPQFPWAEDALNNSGVTDEMDRAEILFDAASDFFRTTAGSDNAYAIAALRRIRNNFEQALQLAADNDAWIWLLHSTYPEKFEYVGEEVYRRLIPVGLQLAEDHSCGTSEGRLIFLTSMFAMGHQFATDPLFPWIQKTLTDTRITDPEARVSRLRSRMQLYLDSVLERLDG